MTSSAALATWLSQSIRPPPAQSSEPVETESSLLVQKPATLRERDKLKSASRPKTRLVSLKPGPKSPEESRLVKIMPTVERWPTLRFTRATAQLFWGTVKGKGNVWSTLAV